MESGTFNNVKKIGNCIIKTSKNDNISNQIMQEMHSGSIYNYVKDINNTGIKTGKLYGYYDIFKYSIIIQEFIKGMTIQSYLEDNNINIKTKLQKFKEFLLLYNKSKINDNLCLDWNMKNFILSTDDIYYIDFVPCLYKDKIRSVTSDNLLQYKDSYLDNNIQVSGILGYAIMPFIKTLSIKDSTIVYEEMKSLFDIITGIKIDNKKDNNHVYLYKLNQIENYLNNNISYDELIKNISSYSMTKILKREYSLSR